MTDLNALSLTTLLQQVRSMIRTSSIPLEVVAAGGHNILLIGPQGAGKTVLARTFPSLLLENAVPYPFRTPYAGIDDKALRLPKPVCLGHYRTMSMWVLRRLCEGMHMLC